MQPEEFVALLLVIYLNKSWSPEGKSYIAMPSLLVETWGPFPLDRNKVGPSLLTKKERGWSYVIGVQNKLGAHVLCPQTYPGLSI